jgi:hypothetical protein
MVHEVTSPQAFGPAHGRPQAATARPDDRHRGPQHPTVGASTPADIKEEDSRIQVQTLEKNVAEFGVPYIPILDVRQESRAADERTGEGKRGVSHIQQMGRYLDYWNGHIGSNNDVGKRVVKLSEPIRTSLSGFRWRSIRNRPRTQRPSRRSFANLKI